MQYTSVLGFRVVSKLTMNNSPVLSQIGNRVRARRASMGWTLREVAERSGLSARFLSDLEAGKGNISVARLADVARALDVSLVSLMPSEDGQQPVVALVGYAERENPR